MQISLKCIVRVFYIPSFFWFCVATIEVCVFRAAASVAALFNFGGMFMYDKIGGKIKTLTKALTILVIVASVIYGIVLLSLGQVWGIIYILIMPFLIWASSFVLYGFGELIEKVCNIEKNIRKGSSKTDTETEQKDNDEDCEKKEDDDGDEYNTYNERIAKIEELRDQGLITEEEYITLIPDEKSKLISLKQMLDDGAISEEKYEELRKEILDNL